MSGREFLEHTLLRLLEWIRAADAKIAPILAITTTMLAVIAALAPSPADWTMLSAAVGVVTVVLLFASLLCLFLAAVPRTEGPPGSVVYFEGIAKRSVDEYSQVVRELSDENYFQDLAEQCHQNARIATSKYGLLRLSMLFLFLAIGPWLLLVYLLYRTTA